MAMVVVGYTCVQSVTVLCTSITLLWARTCVCCLRSFDQNGKVVMATVVVGCILCVQNTMAEETGIMQIYCLMPFLLATNVTMATILWV